MNLKELTKCTKTRHLKRTNELVSSNFRMELDTLNAYSYKWWLFCTKVNGKIVFNNASYSSSTCKHQNKALRVLNYETDLTLKFTRKSLSNLKEVLTDEIRLSKSAISGLIEETRKPRTHRAKNEERKGQVSNLIKHISNIRKLMSEV